MNGTTNRRLSGEAQAQTPRLGRLRAHFSMLRDYFGRTLRPEPLPDATSGRRSDPAENPGQAPGLNLPLPHGGPLPPGHYSLMIEIETGAEDPPTPLLEVISVHGTRHRSIHFDGRSRTPSIAFVCDLALTSAAGMLRLLPGTETSPERCSPVRLRRLTRLEFYGRMVYRLAARRRGEGDAMGTVVAGLGAVLRTGGLRGLAATLRRLDHLSPDVAYEQWMRTRERLDDWRKVYARRLDRAAEAVPLFSVVLIVDDEQLAPAIEAVASVRDQAYEAWELFVVLRDSAPPAFRIGIAEAIADDPRMQLIVVFDSADTAVMKNVALGRASGAWVAAFDASGKLAPTALAAIAFDAVDHAHAEFYYGDDDALGPGGERCMPRFKPDFSRELLRSCNYMGELLFIRTALLRSLGGWRSGFGPADAYDLALRCFERIGGSAIRHVPQVLHHRRPKPDGSASLAALRRALEDHAGRLGLTAAVEEVPDVEALRLRHAVPRPEPLVSLIVPTRDKVDLLRGCVESILRLTTYENYEILVVDNGSNEADALAYLAELRRRDRVRVIPDAHPFNFSRINNHAVRAARGAIVGLVNNDTLVITPDWLTEMVSWAIQPDVGCVGAKLYYANDTIQHAGVVVGVGDVAGHVYRHFPRANAGYCGRLKLVQNLSAVTAACLIVRKSVYEAVGGLNERDLTVAYNDVDFCLKVGAAGYVNVWTPFAELYHLESLSRGSDRSAKKARRYGAEVAYMHSNWDLSRDPYYSPHLTRLREDVSIAV